MSIFVRRAIGADLDALLPLCRGFHQESPVHARLRFDDAKVEDLIRAAITDPGWLAMVAVNDDAEIVGMLLFYCMEGFFTRELEVADLTFYVVPEHRGGRTAIKMLGEVIRWARAKQAARVQIGVTTGINHAQAIRFFEKYGFESTGTLLQCSNLLSG